MHLFMENSNAFSFFFFFCFSFLISLFQPLFADVDSRITPPPPQPPLPLPFPVSPTPFKPSIALIIGVLTTMFSITLLLLLYVRHCKRARLYSNFHGDQEAATTTEARKNSGIDRAVIQSLPVFRFSSLAGQKNGLECAVCLTKFESPEVVRLLPKCKHAFHVECVDTWLDAHSTCPLCRYRVDPEDVHLIDRDSAAANAKNILSSPEDGKAGKRILGRHSSAGEKVSGFGQRQWGGVLPQRTTLFSRRSLDSHSFKKNMSSNESEVAGVRCFDRHQSNQRKDGLLLTKGEGESDSRRTSTGGVGAGVDVNTTRFEPLNRKNNE